MGAGSGFSDNPSLFAEIMTMIPLSSQIRSAYPVCNRLLADESLPVWDTPLTVDNLPERLSKIGNSLQCHPYLPDLARVEHAVHSLNTNPPDFPARVDELTLNPAVVLLPVSWNDLPERLWNSHVTPQRAGNRFALIWRTPQSRRVQAGTASGHDLLALKVVSEKIPSRQAADDGGVSLGTIDNILYAAAQKGLLLAPDSRIARPPDFSRGEITDEAFLVSRSFTLQWHITQACDLHCRHCYDRSDRHPMPLEQAIRVLDDLYDFCRRQHVYGQITFTGGNPLLYPHFDEVYRQAAERGFLTAVLGNPMPRQRIESLLHMQELEFYQVSLEGLAEHNDYIRGRGHFQRVLGFLDVLRDLKVYSMVMLTLTDANMDQVLPLAEHLRGRTDVFTFNRLSPVGEGAELAPADIGRYRPFLETYLQAARANPTMQLKDNLFNILLHEKKGPFFGGCAGYGCGAAFNFVSLLPDGEVHACRKLPSLIGNIKERPLYDIYQDEAARRYRAGTGACSGCAIRPVCGGCLAVSYGSGLDIFSDRDPYCFMENR